MVVLLKKQQNPTLQAWVKSRRAGLCLPYEKFISDKKRTKQAISHPRHKCVSSEDMFGGKRGNLLILKMSSLLKASWWSAHLGWMPALNFLKTSSLLHPMAASRRVSPLPVVQGKSSCKGWDKIFSWKCFFSFGMSPRRKKGYIFLPALCVFRPQTTLQKLPCKDQVRHIYRKTLIKGST